MSLTAILAGAVGSGSVDLSLRLAGAEIGQGE